MYGRLILAALGITLAAAPAQAQNNNRNRSQTNRMRFVEMDANNDGRITRAEWRGSAQSFRVHDWNGDGVLSGDEVRVGAQRAQTNPGDFTGDHEYEYDDWTARGFTGLDHNRDGRLTRDEWHFDYESFRRADHNRDGVVSRAEFLSEGDAYDDDRGDVFAFLDANNDGRVARSEWHASRQSFDNLDDNRDGSLSRAEMRGNDVPPDLFTSIDVNHDGTIRIDEWHWSRQSWDQRDANRDGRLTREEFLRGSTVGTSGTVLPTQSTAYKAGFERGQAEGRQAGREDRHASWGYDLEGQRELQQADSGYDSRYGPRAEYQSGYRAGFRQAYPEGFRQGQ